MDIKQSSGIGKDTEVKSYRMAWQDNLISNLIVFSILVALLMIIWSNITKKPMMELVKEIKEIVMPKEIVE